MGIEAANYTNDCGCNNNNNSTTGDEGVLENTANISTNTETIVQIQSDITTTQEHIVELQEVVFENQNSISDNGQGILQNESDITDLKLLTKSNIPSQTIQVDIPWDENIQEYAQIWAAINNGDQIIIENNSQLHFRTKRLVSQNLGDIENYTVITNTWREEKKYKITSSDVNVILNTDIILGVDGNLELSSVTSRLYLDDTVNYTVTNGVISGGVVEDLGAVSSGIADAVNSLTETLYVFQEEYLFKDNDGNQWIYAGGLEEIGAGVTTVNGDYTLLTPENAANTTSEKLLEFKNNTEAINAGLSIDDLYHLPIENDIYAVAVVKPLVTRTPGIFTSQFTSQFK